MFEEKVDFPPVWRDNVDVKLGAGVTQLVECDLAKVDVAGSNPVSRSNFPRNPFVRLRFIRTNFPDMGVP